ncbi:MAG TPA: isoleucine--tRNA ligase [Mycobacteriales bacterium]|nr:isoleucine--tRNA ligase [Mycobacteriales bacterium]
MSHPGFSPVPAQLDLPAMELRILERWAETDVFGRSLAQTKDGPVWVFYDGPPTANGKPGAHHVEPRVFKDLFPRFKTMKGHHVPRRGGWDCHGLPVELAVEKELGFSGKGDIEAYGVEEFNARCRESVLRHVAEHEELSRRMGYWVDQVGAYRTMDPDYIESVWWSLQVIFDKGLLVEDHRVAPYCPRCGTALSDHEVAQGYAMVTDPSVYVRLPVTSGPLAERGADLLIWTTTPWTLVSNVAVAVHPEVTYVLVRAAGGELLVVAEALVEKAVGEGAEVLERMSGHDLERTTYQRPFGLVEMPGEANYVALADYVTTEDGTGLVHTAPAFGAEDLAVGRQYGLPVVNPITPKGEFAADVPMVGGRFFKDADKTLTEDLRSRGLLWRAESYEHSYAHCWRCDTPLINYAMPSWYIRTTAVKDRLLAENARTDWHPPSIRDGRYGDWLHNNIDWSVSRNRYWGTPLPIWRCAGGSDADAATHLTCVGSLAELSSYAGLDLADLDPHRPFVDEVTFDCPQCGALATRVPEVIDCWYDAGSMPFAQWGAPHRNLESQQREYPANFIAEAIDQTRGWFYTLMAIGTLVFDKSSYETVLCLGHIVDADGRKMSKHLGNILDPFELFAAHGADPVRWLLLCVGNPWANRRVHAGAIDEVVRKVLLTYWNTVSFLTLYASVDGWRPDSGVEPAGERPLIDRWLISELHRTVIEVDAALEDFDPTRAGRRLTEFVDDLSNWYVRRCRRRFWKGSQTGDGRHAFGTLYEALLVLTKLLAPFVPFITEEVWTALGQPQADSVHLTPWPVVDGSLVDPGLGEQMALVRRLVELGRATRAESGVKTRQPLGRALIGAPGWSSLPAELRQQVADELNVTALADLSAEGELVDVAVKPNFRALGARFGKGTPAVAAAIGAADATALAASLESTGSATVEVDGVPQQIGQDDVVVTESPRTGWAVASEGGATVALDLTVTPELRRAGLARDAVRAVQDTRKTSGLDVTDRIELWWSAEGDVGEAMVEHGSRVAEEVLAVRFEAGPPTVDMAPHHDEELGLTWWLRRAGE